MNYNLLITSIIIIWCWKLSQCAPVVSETHSIIFPTEENSNGPIDDDINRTKRASPSELSAMMQYLLLQNYANNFHQRQQRQTQQLQQQQLQQQQLQQQLNIHHQNKVNTFPVIFAFPVNLQPIQNVPTVYFFPNLQLNHNSVALPPPQMLNQGFNRAITNSAPSQAKDMINPYYFYPQWFRYNQQKLVESELPPKIFPVFPPNQTVMKASDLRFNAASQNQQQPSNQQGEPTQIREVYDQSNQQKQNIRKQSSQHLEASKPEISNADQNSPAKRVSSALDFAQKQITQQQKPTQSNQFLKNKPKSVGNEKFINVKIMSRSDFSSKPSVRPKLKNTSIEFAGEKIGEPKAVLVKREYLDDFIYPSA